MKKYLSILISGIIAGALITIGATINLMCLSIGQKVLGAFMFAIGLFTIIVYKQYLFTGKIGYVFHNKPNYLIDLLICLIGNTIGVIALTSLIKLSRINPTLLEYSTNLVNTKVNDTWYSILVLSIMCGMMVYLAVDGFKNCENVVGKVLFVFISVALFILCGFEHCIADMAYFAFAKVYTGKAILYILIMIIGNSIGAIILDGLFTLVKKFNN